MKPDNGRLDGVRAAASLVLLAAATAASLLAGGPRPSARQVTPARAIPAGAFASVIEASSFAYCCIEHEGGLADIQMAIQALMLETQSQNIYPSGPIMVVYDSDPNLVDPDAIVWEVGFPVTPQVMPQAPLFKKVWYYTSVARAYHFGAYYEIDKTIERLMAWIDDNGYTAAGPILERYLDLAPDVPASAGLRTEIWVPVGRR